MFAIVKDGSIISFPKGNKGISITTTAEVDGEDVDTTINYPSSIYTLWTEPQRNAIGVYTVVINNTNFKDQTFYINTEQTYTFDADADTVTVTYGTATAKAIADTLFTAQDETDGLGTEDDVKQKGLKTNYKENFNSQASELLARTDWYVVKGTEVSDYTVPSAITTYRAAVRTKVNAMETAIANCANVAALETLLEYTSNDADPPVTSRPLGEFPDEVV